VLICAYDATQDLPAMQASFSRRERILPALSAALQPGQVCKLRVSFADDSTAGFDDFILAVSLSGVFYQIKNFISKPPSFC
jgi:hypothetical protein